MVYLSFRLLAHAKVESVKTKEAAEQRRLKKKSWFSFGWLVGTLFVYCLFSGGFLLIFLISSFHLCF